MSEWLSLVAFPEHQGPYKPYNHSLYTEIIIFPDTDNTQITGRN